MRTLSDQSALPVLSDAGQEAVEPGRNANFEPSDYSM